MPAGGAGSAARRLETVDVRSGGQPRARRAPAGVAHRGQDPALEVEVRPGGEADLAARGSGAGAVT